MGKLLRSLFLSVDRQAKHNSIEGVAIKATSAVTLARI